MREAPAPAVEEPVAAAAAPHAASPASEPRQALEAMLEGLSAVLREHGLDAVLTKAHCESVPGCVPGDCYKNVEKLVSLNPARFEGVFGYMIALQAAGRLDSGFDIELRPHAVVRLHSPDGAPLRLLEVSTGTSGGQTLFLEDPQISFEMHQQLKCDAPLRALLRRGFSHPSRVRTVIVMPFGRDHAAEDDLNALFRGEPTDWRGRTGRTRMWELQRFTAGGVVRTIGTGVYHDELCKGVEVGVSRDAVLAAILERGARASE
jgi:hypothetical protein